MRHIMFKGSLYDNHDTTIDIRYNNLENMWRIEIETSMHGVIGIASVYYGGNGPLMSVINDEISEIAIDIATHKIGAASAEFHISYDTLGKYLIMLVKARSILMRLKGCKKNA